MNMPRTTNLSHSASVALLFSALLTGCNAPANWDKEYACRGQEQSSTVFKEDDPAHTIEKTYPMTVDFHLRSQKVFVKTYVADLAPGVTSATKSVHFESKSPNAWLSGQFDPTTGQLTLIEGRALEITGRTQQIRSSGQYLCQ